MRGGGVDEAFFSWCLMESQVACVNYFAVKTQKLWIWYSRGRSIPRERR